MIGSRLGPYEITAKLGEGGMGAVYRARDTKLERDVAIKVLPEALTESADSLARFEREAKVLAQLHHPHVASIFGLEESEDGARALVLELVEGPTLAERLDRGPLTVDEALDIARQITAALEAAHEKGIVHRDLKPQNVKAPEDGPVKVLDFGLAKAMDPSADSAPGSHSQIAASPTLTLGATQQGVILGTAAYMAPEQAKGLAVDKRADIWAFGVVLFEMLTGKRLFDGDSVPEVLAGVLKTEVDLDALPDTTPPAIRRLLRRCLARNPKNRLHDIADARLVIDDVVAGSVDLETTASRVPAATAARRRELVAWTLVALGAIFGVSGWLARSADGPAPSDLPVSRFAIPLPPDAPFGPGGTPSSGLAISNDGRRIAYLARSDPWKLQLRDLDELEIRPIADGFGRQPFFSPDGEWVAFFSGNTLQKVSLRGGAPIILARGFVNGGWMLGTWCDDGTIVFDTWNDGLRAVDENGGPVRTLTEPTDVWHLDPRALPGACRVLYFTQTGTEQSIEVLSLADGSRRTVLGDASHGRYLTSGHLLFVRDGAVQVAPFDLDSLEIRGPALPVPFDVVVDAINTSAPTPQLDVSRNGTLVYAPATGSPTGAQVVRMGLDGSRTEAWPVELARPSFQLAPDGRTLAMAGRRQGAARIESLDLDRRTTTRLVEDEADYPAAPVWSADGRSVFYSRYGAGEGEILRREVKNGAEGGEPVMLAKMPGTWFCPWTASPDGRYLVFSAYRPATGADLWLLDLERAPAADAVTSLVSSPNSEHSAAISPDGRWMAYVSDSAEGGADQILVERFPSGGERSLIANASDSPLWSPDGREIYYARTGAEGLRMMAVPVERTPAPRAGDERQLFSGRFLASNDMGRSYALAPDGESFLLVEAAGDAPLTGYSEAATELVVVEGWFTELRELQGPAFTESLGPGRTRSP